MVEQAKMRTEENLLALESLAKTEAQFQALVELQEEEKIEAMSVDYPVHVNFIYPDYSIYLSQGSISTFDSIVLHRTRSRTQINGGGGVVPDTSACPSGCMLSPEVPSPCRILSPSISLPTTSLPPFFS